MQTTLLGLSAAYDAVAKTGQVPALVMVQQSLSETQSDLKQAAGLRTPSGSPAAH
jgi:hypothetical protein